MKAVIIGSTGLTGNLLLEKLLESSQITEVLSISRVTTGKKHVKLKELIVRDFKNLREEAKNVEGELFFCCLGTTIKKAKSKENFYKIDYQAVIDFAQMAKEGKAKVFSVISANGVKANSSFFYYQVKYKMEQYLKNMGLPTLHIFHPALISGGRQEMRLGEKIAEIIFFPLAFFPQKIRATFLTPPERLALSMLRWALSFPNKNAVVGPKEI